MTKRAIPIIVVAAAFAGALVPLSPRAVDRFYSSGFYPRLQPLLTGASNRVPFAIVDALLFVVAFAWLSLAARDLLSSRRTGWLKGGGRVLWRTAVWSAALYLCFLLAWGLNYRRVRLIDKVAYRSDAVTPAAALLMTNRAVDDMNALHARAHAAGWGAGGAIDPTLADLVERAARELVDARALVVARPKRSLLDWYFRRTAVSGMTDPFFLETLVASDVLPFERPVVVAHEWMHLAGIADEGDANFGAWLACVRGPVAAQYSAWVFLYQELLPSISARERPQVAARLADGPRADLRAIRERYERNVSPRLSAAGWRVYDSYLKANRVEAGAASYAEVVRLVLGVRFGDDWTLGRPQ